MEYFFVNTDADSLRDEPLPRFHRLIEGHFVVAGGDRAKYGQQIGRLQVDDIALLYENRVGIVAIGRVAAPWNEVAYTTPEYYSTAELQECDGGPCEYRISVDWTLDLSSAPVDLEQLGERGISTPRGTVQRVVGGRRSAVARLIEDLNAEALLGAETLAPGPIVEGAPRQSLSDSYVRSRLAVSRCKEIHGSNCCICGLDFGKTYGREFEGFIHVHHLRPLSQLGRGHVVDPERDLRPVCPNCHAVIHFGKNLRSIEDVRQLLAQSVVRQ